MGVKLVSSGGGSVEINPPATASSFIATMPAGTGTVSVNGVSSNIVLGTAQNSTSGTSIDFTGIPSWVRRITVMFNGVSTNGSSVIQIQIGSGSFSTSGYASAASFSNIVNAFLYATTGFIIDTANTATASMTRSGVIQLNLFGSNVWAANGNISSGAAGQVACSCAGNSPTLSGTLDRVRITTVNGTDAFDAGSINIMYE